MFLRKFLIVPVIILSFTINVFAADNLKDMFTEGTVRGDIRMLDFTRDFDNINTRKDIAMGGTLYYKTSQLYGISFGVAMGTANDIASDDDDSVYSVLAADDDGDHVSLSRKQEYYIQGNWFKTEIKYGAQEINTPYMNTDDVRMLPRSYKGLSIVNNSIDSLTLSAYYITDTMNWNDESFVPISDTVAGKDGYDKDLMIFGAAYTLPIEAVKTRIEGWYYTLDDYFNTAYLKASFSKDINSVNVYFNPSILRQKSQGDENIGDYNSKYMGFSTGVKFAGFNLTGSYAKTVDDAFYSPWGFDKIIAQQVMTSGTRADEDAWAAKIAYDFGQVGLKGLSAYVFYAYYDVDETDVVKDVYETDYNIQYSFSGSLEGLKLRARYADMNVHNGESLVDTRLYVIYTFKFEGK